MNKNLCFVTGVHHVPPNTADGLRVDWLTWLICLLTKGQKRSFKDVSLLQLCGVMLLVSVVWPFASFVMAFSAVHVPILCDSIFINFTISITFDCCTWWLLRLAACYIWDVEWTYSVQVVEARGGLWFQLPTSACVYNGSGKYVGKVSFWSNVTSFQKKCKNFLY